MSKEKIEWAIYTNPETEDSKTIYYNDIDKEEYNSKYKNHLTCASDGCIEARVKFTSRKNGIKFFSTWNKDGNKHDISCPFRVEYKGKIGREKLVAYCEEIQPNDEAILNSLLNKIKGLKRKYNGEEKNKKHTYSKVVDNVGESDVLVGAENSKENNNIDVMEKRKNITSIDANYLTKAYVEFSKCVYGVCNNVQIEEENGAYYGYINLNNSKEKVSIYFPEAFYSQEDGITLDEFKKVFEILKKEINNNNKNAIVVCYGKIRSKQKDGLNVYVINPKHVMINEMSFRKILLSGKLNDIDYDIV